jgi:hypothetical protein
MNITNRGIDMEKSTAETQQRIQERNRKIRNYKIGVCLYGALNAAVAVDTHFAMTNYYNDQARGVATSPVNYGYTAKATKKLTDNAYNVAGEGDFGFIVGIFGAAATYTVTQLLTSPGVFVGGLTVKGP